MKKCVNYQNYEVSENGDVYNTVTKRFLKQRIDHTGYMNVTMRDNGGKWRTVKVHRILAQTYIPNPDDKPEVNHIDGVKTNNKLTNLEWVTSKENKQHGLEMGLYDNIIAEKNITSTLSNEQVHKICLLLQDGVRNSDVADMMGISRDIVGHIKSGNIWKSISCEYTFKVERQNRKDLKDVILVCEAIQRGESVDCISDNFPHFSRRDILRIRNKSMYSTISNSYF